MTLDKWKKKAADIGIPPGEAEKFFKAMDKNGDDTVTEDEFQNLIGVSEKEVLDRILDEFGNADKALEAADADGDGQISKEELQKMLHDKLGLTPENAAKAATQMIKKLGAGSSGKIPAEDFKEAILARAAEEIKNYISKSAPQALDVTKRKLS